MPLHPRTPTSAFNVPPWDYEPRGRIAFNAFDGAVPGALANWPAGPQRIYLVDPLGNLVLAWPREPDIKKVGKDIERLLRASRIG